MNYEYMKKQMRLYANYPQYCAYLFKVWTYMMEQKKKNES